MVRWTYILSTALIALFIVKTNIHNPIICFLGVALFCVNYASNIIHNLNLFDEHLPKIPKDFFTEEDFDADNGGYGPYAKNLRNIANKKLNKALKYEDKP